MVSLGPILPHVLPLMLVVSRITGLFLFTPMLSGGSVPRQFKVLLAFMFGVAVYPFIPATGAGAAIDLVSLAPLIFAELLIGAAIGIIASIPLLAAQMGGFVMGFQIGLSLAESFNPELESNGSAIGDIVFYLGAFAFVGFGGMDLLFTAITDSFVSVPLGAFDTGQTPLDLLVGVLTSGFELAIRVAAPVMGIVATLFIAMGFVMKTMPQVNIMTVGFSAQIVCGLVMLLLSLAVISNVVNDELMHAIGAVADWIHAMGVHRG